MEKITPEFMAGYTAADKTPAELVSERRKYVLERIECDEPFDIAELAWLERNPTLLIDTSTSKKEQRQQFILAHIALRGYEPLRKRDRTWLEETRLVRRLASNRYKFITDVVLADPMHDDPISRPLVIEGAGTMNYMGWDDPEIDDELIKFRIENVYKRELDKITVFSPGDQKELARVVRAGAAAAEKLPTNPDDKQLENLVQDGHDAKNTLWQSSLRLVPFVIKEFFPRYHNTAPRHGVQSYQDLIQEGNLGLERAILKYDPDHESNANFSTYAVKCIKNYISKSQRNMSDTIRIPLTTKVEINGIRTQNNDQLHDKQLTPQELANRYHKNIPLTVKQLLLTDEDTVVSLDKVQDESLADFSDQFAADSDNIPESLNILLSQNEQDESYPTVEDADDSIFREQLAQEIGGLVNGYLGERARKIITMRFGLDGNGPNTLETISRVFGVSRERIRQIESASLIQLGHPLISKRLKSFYDSNI